MNQPWDQKSTLGPGCTRSKSSSGCTTIMASQPGPRPGHVHPPEIAGLIKGLLTIGFHYIIRLAIKARLFLGGGYVIGGRAPVDQP